MNGVRYLSSCINSSTSRGILSLNLQKKSRIFHNTVKSLQWQYNKLHCSAYLGADSEPLRGNSENIVNNKKNYRFQQGPDLADFILANAKTTPTVSARNHPYLKTNYGPEQKVYFDVYGCQMNVNDTEIVWSVLKGSGYTRTIQIDEADIVLVMTCAIREGAEQKIWARIDQLNSLKRKRKHLRSRFSLRIGILGCMAERLKARILERKKAVDLVAGPDSYRDLPRLLSIVENHETAINVQLSAEETYADITPVRLNPDSVSAFVSIMRGCDNMCTYCIVPFVRGRERSRPLESILNEVQQLSEQGIKEITLLGQNVNSYRDLSQCHYYFGEKNPTHLAKGFRTVYKNKLGGLRFSDLLDKVSLVNPEMRIRFTSPHPKDFPDEVLHLISERPNICKQIHLPAQSGNSAVLERMRRGYTRESYLELVEHIRSIIPQIKLSSDFIAGFCNETHEEFEDTMTLIDQVKFHQAFLFQYSMREKTTAHRRYEDNVSPEMKSQRLTRMIHLWRSQVENLNRLQVGTHQLVLIEGLSKKSSHVLQGRTDGNTRVIIHDPAIPSDRKTDVSKTINSGDYIVAQICGSNSNTLTGIPLYHTTISEYARQIASQKQRHGQYS
ncbi:CDK5 regulatory subunit-associated protein 1 [Diachasma alloeum]|uniref:CDK5 regulatory subunit-associated protein 1 n=1 Tax=Diachasma alloeum TaxID=454923 RepID=UPI0007385079|nr:CDK5 regulatory subunit-associated protein 1 [Diachasma alloeum]